MKLSIFGESRHKTCFSTFHSSYSSEAGEDIVPQMLCSSILGKLYCHFYWILADHQIKSHSSSWKNALQ